MPIKLIAIDLDGTLLSKDHMTITLKNKRALEKAIEQGIHVVFATGRTLHDIPKSLRGLMGIRYAITSNGAQVSDLKTGETIFSLPIPLETAKAVLSSAEEARIYTEVYTGGKAYCQKNLKSEKLEKEPLFILYRLLLKRTELENLSDFIQRNPDPIEKIELLADCREVSEKINGLLEKLPLTVTTSGMNSVEITSEGTTKAAGLALLCSQLGITADETMAIGDSLNDFEMLAWAGISVAVENADEELKKHASFVTRRYDENGVAYAIEKYIKH